MRVLTTIYHLICGHGFWHIRGDVDTTTWRRWRSGKWEYLPMTAKEHDEEMMMRAIR
jgi:5-formyltetrahydrofolate cyclo-ligase